MNFIDSVRFWYSRPNTAPDPPEEPDGTVRVHVAYDEQVLQDRNDAENAEGLQPMDASPSAVRAGL